MDKKLVCKALEEMATLMDLKGENLFKIRAYRNAARILTSHPSDIQSLLDSGEIHQIKGIGKGIAGFIIDLVSRGESDDLDKLRQEIPPGVIEMLKIPGMGPRKAKAIWEKLQINTVGELEYACQENRLIDLDGFGQKTQEKIKQGIERIKKYSERHLISKATEEADLICGYLRAFSGIIRLEVGGSLRRWQETIKEINIVCGALPSNQRLIMDQMATYPELESIQMRVENKIRILLKSGITAEIEVVTDESFPHVLLQSTGSSDHFNAIQDHIDKIRFKIQKYGLYNSEGSYLPCREEAEIYQNLGLQYIPPELRENTGEIVAARAGKIPELVNWDDIKGVIHVHSNYSDGSDSIEELAHACQTEGFDYLVISDHSRSAAYAGGLSVEQLRKQFKEIDEINQKLHNLRILKSIECDILPDGKLDYPDDILSLFDLVIISIHSRFKMTESEATHRILKAMENPFVTIVGHLTGRLLLAREGYPVNIQAVLDAAASLQIALELNANPHRLDLDWRWLRSAKEKGVKISINPDAHRIEGIHDIRYGIGIARKGWLSPADVLNCLSTEDLLAFAKRRRSN